MLIIAVLAIIITVHYDVYRRVRLFLTTIDALEKTRTRRGQRRTVALITLNDGEMLDSYTVKSLLDQSIRPHEISVETAAKNRPSDSEYVKFHPKDTLSVREDDASNIIIRVKNGQYYDWDYIEKTCTI